MVGEFFGEIDIDMHYIEKMNNAIKSATIRDTIDSMFLTLMIGMDGIKDDDVFIKKLGSLGRIGRSEFVTPASIVKKMIDKCEDVIDDSSRILLVNEKQCEFLSEIKQRFGQHVANNCRIVASGQMTRILIGKMLNHLGLSADILINIPDVNNNNKYDLGDFLQMNNKEFLKDTNETKPFDVCLMNPPYANNESNCLDINFVNKTLNLSNKIVAIFPNYLDNKNAPYLKFFNANNIHSMDFIESAKAFDISTTWKYVCIYDIDSNKKYDKIEIDMNNKHYVIDNNNTVRQEFVKQLNWDELCDVIKHKKQLYDDLIKANGTMVHDGHGFIYEENKIGLYGIKKPAQKKLARVKQYLKDGTYKYCIYKGSGNNSYNKPQEWLGQDVDTLFNGQACWLTNKANVRDNIKYWMECPLFDLWRKYYFNNAKLAVCWIYIRVPALDFEMSTDKFKEYVDSLNTFTEKDIEIMKKYNIHNIDRYDK